MEEIFDGDYVRLPDDILIQNPPEDDSIDILIDHVFRIFLLIALLPLICVSV
jgi:hypothetical protein